MKPFIPQKLPLEQFDWLKILPSLGPANRELARYDGFLQSLPNAALLLAPLTTQEAVLSSKIEGTQATLEDVLRHELQRKSLTQKQNDIQEVINYRYAMQFAIEELKKRPLSLNLIKKMHSILLRGVRGRNLNPGEFRKVQNWIGAPGRPINEAHFIPPPPYRLQEALDNFEKYIHYSEKDHLVQLAIIHAQFEIIHPFLDGNGRIGRILIPLFLYEKKILKRPMFYISEYFEKHRSEYYQNLLKISKNEEWEEWIIFFLKAIETQAKKNILKARQILELYNEMKTKILEITHSQYSIITLDTLFKIPILDSLSFQKKSKIPKASAKRILSRLKKANIISLLEEGKGRQPHTYIFEHLINIILS